jgi:hypothetical protein
VFVPVTNFEARLIFKSNTTWASLEPKLRQTEKYLTSMKEKHSSLFCFSFSGKEKVVSKIFKLQQKSQCFVPGKFCQASLGLGSRTQAEVPLGPLHR